MGCVVDTITVGTDPAKDFAVHRTLLGATASKLKTIRGDSSKAQRVALKGEDPVLFDHFVKWMYQNWPYNPFASVHVDNDLTLVRLYAIGYRLGADKFQE